MYVIKIHLNAFKINKVFRNISRFSLKSNKSWRLKHNFFHFDPLQGDYNVGGVNFQWTDGVFGMALGKPINDEG